ncbi:conserved hypothetical protein [Gammaproteobacteria bacterium]
MKAGFRVVNKGKNMVSYNLFKKNELFSSTDNGLMHPLKKLVTASPDGIGQLMDRIQELQKLSLKVSDILTPQLIPHCQVANVRGTVLVLQVDSSAWATRLHYQVPAILDYLQTHGWSTLSEIQVRVGSPEPIPAPPAPPTEMSKKTIELLLTLARTDPDVKLRAAWGKLASHGMMQ